MDKHTSFLCYLWATICAASSKLDLNDLTLIIGIVATIATVAINWFYKRKDFLHKKRLREQYYRKHKELNKDD